jgi:hypothetical protein
VYLWSCWFLFRRGILVNSQSCFLLAAPVQVLQYVQQQLQTYVSSHGPGAKQRGAPAGKTTAAAGSSSSSAGGDGQQQVRLALVLAEHLFSGVYAKGSSTSIWQQ